MSYDHHFAGSCDGISLRREGPSTTIRFRSDNEARAFDRIFRDAIYAHVGDRPAASTDPLVGSDRTTIELKMTAFADAAPERDEFHGEQTILTYTDRVGTWDLAFFESGEDFPERWLGDTHWIDITRMRPGVISQVETCNGSDRDDGITIGIAMSVAFLLRDRDDPVPALEWWNAAGLTIEQCERVGLDEYDLQPIRAALSAPEADG